MARFRFNLQRVLDIRKMQEEKLKTELAFIGGLLQREVKILDDLYQKQEGILIRYEKALKKGVTIEQIFEFQSKTVYYERVIKEQIETVNKLKIQFERKRVEVVQASKKRKILEKLKEKKYAEFKKSEEIADQKTMDEMASNLYFQKNTREEFYGRNQKSLR